MAAAPPLPAAAVPAPAQADAAPAQRFSLGAALVGGVPDATCAEPQEQAPLAWQLSLVSKHADAVVLWGLFRSCRGGRDLVLQHAPQVTLTLPLLLDQSSDQWIAQHCQIKSALTTRGRLPTRIHLDGWEESDTPVTVRRPMPLGLLQLLLNSSTAAGITKAALESCLGDYPQPSTATQVLEALPSLTRLDLGFVLPIPLPPPSHLPLLRDLRIEFDASAGPQAEACQRAFSGLQPYMPQLTCLRVCGHHKRPYQLPFTLLFTAAAPAQSLTSLRVRHTALTDLFLDLLLDHAPALAHLSIERVNLRTGAHRQREWGVNSMTVWKDSHVGMEHLPACKAGKVTWQQPHLRFLSFQCLSEQGLEPAFAERLPEWVFDMPVLSLHPSAQLAAIDQPEALRNALTQLNTHLPTPAPVIELSGWRLTDAFVSTLATALPAQSGLRLGVELGVVRTASGTILSDLRRMSPRVCSLSAKSFKGTEALTTPWPWAALFVSSVTSVELPALLSMPTSGNGEERTICAGEVRLDSTLTQTQARDLRRLLATVLWAHGWSKTHYITLEAFPRAPASALSAQLSLLHEMRFADDAPARISLSGLPITDDVMSALEGLPDWPETELRFEKCTWPLQANEYVQLAQYVPTSYTEWYLECDPAVLEQICVGVDQRRARLGAKPLVLHAQVKKQKRMGEHVIVRY